MVTVLYTFPSESVTEVPGTTVEVAESFEQLEGKNKTIPSKKMKHMILKLFFTITQI